jgi:hypothetical protein
VCSLGEKNTRAGTIRRRHLHVYSALIYAAVGLAVQGCSTDDDLPRQSISGLIRLDGRPLPLGIVHYYPRSTGGRRPSVFGGAMIRNGRFSIPREIGLIPGKYTVAVFTGVMTQTKRENNQVPGNAHTLAPEMVPAKYNSASNLEIEIKDSHGIKDMTIDIESR